MAVLTLFDRATDGDGYTVEVELSTRRTLNGPIGSPALGPNLFYISQDRKGMTYFSAGDVVSIRMELP
jgi:hypothetical protein